MNGVIGIMDLSWKAIDILFVNASTSVSDLTSKIVFTAGIGTNAHVGFSKIGIISGF